MNIIKLLLPFLFLSMVAQSQRSTENDGDWSLQHLVLRNTAEADLMIRVGDIDNLGFGFDADFNPFSGRSTWSHGFPWDVNKTDARGTDRIMIPSSFKNGMFGSDGYAGTSSRPANLPQSISFHPAEVK